MDAVGKLVPSPDGKYWETVNYRHTAHCKLCPAGKYSNSVQSQVCTECPGGNARCRRWPGPRAVRRAAATLSTPVMSAGLCVLRDVIATATP